ncbi:MAG: 5'/3'-nucleotidase SurE [Alphaproteobacteria bacterium]|nr:5'/3'-nucleotidase SurE [Alphaproteobacteria bacterium]
MAEGARTPNRPLDRSTRILITNDDGVNAPGLRVLERIAKALSDDVWVVAPETNQSGASHSLTLQRPLRVRSYGLDDNWYAVDGTPTDCVLLAVRSIVKEKPVDLVLSGVNWGANFAEDVTYSGTVAAAMEATLFNIKAFAFSQVHHGRHAIHWQTAERFAPDLIKKLYHVDWADDLLINLNFPDCEPDAVTGHEVTFQGRREGQGEPLEERLDPRGHPYIWIGLQSFGEAFAPGSDLQAIVDRKISITPIHMDLTHRESIDGIKQALG